MIGRLGYLIVGTLLGGYLMRKIARATRAWSPRGVTDRLEGRVDDYRRGFRELGEDIQEAMERREAELRRRYGPTGPDGDTRPSYVTKGER